MSKAKEVSQNANLHTAKRNKNDEFYTLLATVEEEMKHYRGHLKGKVVYCNCDDPYISAFFEYFSKNFSRLGLKKLITTCYRNTDPLLMGRGVSEKALKIEYCGGAPQDLPTLEHLELSELEGDGDFRSEECIEILQEVDVVITNPPFSLFRDFIGVMAAHEKDFIVLGNVNAITYKEIFPLIKEGKMRLGASSFNKGVYFEVPGDFEYTPKYKGLREKEISRMDRDEGKEKRITVNVVQVPSICWYTSFELEKHSRPLDLFKRYCPKEYPKYDNYDAIEVNRVARIPEDYAGVIGVPITFLDKYCPEQFEILGSDYEVKQGLHPNLINPGWEGKIDRGYVDGVRKYARILIRHCNPRAQCWSA